MQLTKYSLAHGLTRANVHRLNPGRLGTFFACNFKYVAYHYNYACQASIINFLIGKKLLLTHFVYVKFVGHNLEN
jgi:hypothetical protein